MTTRTNAARMIEFGHLTHVGLRRELNEDTYYGDSDLGLWLVADGMGGHEYGEVASALARETIVRQVRAGSSLAEAIRIAVDVHGRAILPDLPADALVAIQQANNESGVVQDMAAIAAAVHAAGGRLVADCVQSAGKLPIPPADFVAVSAHKMGGPMGVGALIVRCKDRFHPVQRGGGQEQGWRGGTENLIGILGWAAALAAWDPDFPVRAAALQALLEREATVLGARVNAADAPRLPTISSLHLPGVPAATQLMQLDMAGISVSQGSACSSGTLKPSPVLTAMGLGEAAGQSLRISTGWSTTEADIRRFLSAWAPLARRAHAA